MTEQPAKDSTPECVLCDTAVTPADDYWCAGCEEFEFRFMTPAVSATAKRKTVNYMRRELDDPITTT